MVLFNRRIRGVREGLNPAYFKLNRVAKLPDDLLIAEQHYQNIHEMPVLFYITVVLIYLAVEVNLFFISTAWAYVLFRLIHSFIHLGNNRIVWRRNAFVASFFTLIAMWLGLMVQMQ